MKHSVNRVHIVTNSLKPFVYETGSILALPEGANYLARFPERWVDNNAVSMFKAGKELVGVIYLRNWKTTEIIPLREIVVKAASKVGDLWLIEYQVGTYFDFKADPHHHIGLSEVLLETLQKEVSENIQYRIENTANGAMWPLVSVNSFNPKLKISNYTNEEGQGRYTEYGKWLNTILQLTDVEILHRFLFVKYSLLNANKLIVFDSDKLRFNLHRNQINQLEIIHKIIEIDRLENADAVNPSRTPENSYLEDSPKSVTLKSVKGATLISPASNTLRGRYDITKYRLHSSNNGHTFDTLELQTTIPNEASHSYSSLLTIDIKYEYSWLGLVFRFLIALISLLVFISINFFDVFNSLAPKAIKDMLAPFAVVIFVLSVKSLWDEIRNHLRS